MKKQNILLWPIYKSHDEVIKNLSKCFRPFLDSPVDRLIILDEIKRMMKYFKSIEKFLDLCISTRKVISFSYFDISLSVYKIIHSCRTPDKKRSAIQIFIRDKESEYDDFVCEVIMEDTVHDKPVPRVETMIGRPSSTIIPDIIYHNNFKI